jgi:hypothetical protein
MKRVLKLRQKVSDIFLYDWSERGTKFWVPGPDTALRFEFREAGIKGVVSLDLDFSRETVDWEPVFDNAGKPLVEIPLACNRLAVVIEGECDDAVTEEEFLRTAQKLTHAHVNRMLAYVRIELSQHWVEPVPVTEWELYWFLQQADATWLQDGKEVEIEKVKGFMFVMPPEMTFDDAGLALDLERRQALYDFMASQMDTSVESELLATAKQSFVTFEYRMAAVEAVSALEVAFQRFIRTLSEARGIPVKKLEDVERSLGASAYLKLLVPLVLSHEELGSYWELVADCDELRRVRNDVVHEGRTPDQREIEIIKRGIIGVERVFDFISDVDRKAKPPD